MVSGGMVGEGKEGAKWGGSDPLWLYGHCRLVPTSYQYHSPMVSSTRRVAYAFLCIAPFLVIGVSVRPLRVPGVYQAVGVVVCAAILVTAGVLGARGFREGEDRDRLLAAAGGLLVFSFALWALLCVGMGTPWEATPLENQTRYLVLLIESVSIAGGLLVLAQVLGWAEERFWSTLGFAAMVLAGPAYLVWASVQFGVFAVQVRDGAPAPGLVSLSDVVDNLLFVAAALTYLATAAIAISLGRVDWIGRRAMLIYVGVSVLALAFLMARGVAFPNPAVLSTPWYTRPGFVAGIPAVPFVMPFLIGVVLLKRAGDGRAGGKNRKRE